MKNIQQIIKEIRNKFTDQYFASTDGRNDIRRKDIHQTLRQIIKSEIEMTDKMEKEFETPPIKPEQMKATPLAGQYHRVVGYNQAIEEYGQHWQEVLRELERK